VFTRRRHTDGDCLEDSAARLLTMYFFSFLDVNLLVAGVLLAKMVHAIKTAVDDIPETRRISYS